MTATPSRPLEPIYTHALHAAACQTAALTRQILVQYVLVLRGPVVYCAIIKNAYTVSGGPDCWTVETSWPEKTRLTVPCKNTIACNPEFCVCRPSGLAARELSECEVRGPLAPFPAANSGVLG